jgi:hypothetical protein
MWYLSTFHYLNHWWASLHIVVTALQIINSFLLKEILKRRVITLLIRYLPKNGLPANVYFKVLVFRKLHKKGYSYAGFVA